MDSNTEISIGNEDEEVSNRTFIRFGESVLLNRCVDLGCECKCSFHCPFCDLKHFKATKPCKVQDHLEESHWPFGVHYKDVFIVRCFHHCNGEKAGHYHCPVCPDFVYNRATFVSHLQFHLEEQNDSTDLAYAPDTKQPPFIVYEGKTLRLCEEACWNNPSPGQNHYHCPACDSVQCTTSSMANHLRKCYNMNKNRYVYGRVAQSSSLENPKTAFAKHWHKTIVRDQLDISVRRCCSRRCCRRQYHCPLCTFERTHPTTVVNLRIHFNYHFDKGVNHNGYMILACHLDCVECGAAYPALHYHCPYCGATESDQFVFSEHLESCQHQGAGTVNKGESLCHEEPESATVSGSPEDMASQIVESDFEDTTDRCETHVKNVDTPTSPQQIEMFDSVRATLSQVFLRVFSSSMEESAEELLTEVAGATSVKFSSSPGTDPRRPILSVTGTLGNILKTESYLYQKFGEVSGDKSIKLKTTFSDGGKSSEALISDHRATPFSELPSMPGSSSLLDKSPSISTTVRKFGSPQKESRPMKRVAGRDSTMTHSAAIDSSANIHVKTANMSSCVSPGFSLSSKTTAVAAEDKIAAHSITAQKITEQQQSPRGFWLVKQDTMEYINDPVESDEYSSTKMKTRSCTAKVGWTGATSSPETQKSLSSLAESTSPKESPATQTKQNDTPKRYNTRGRRVDISMLQRPSKSKDVKKTVATAKSPKASKVSIKTSGHGNVEHDPPKDGQEGATETSRTGNKSPRSTKVFLLNELPDDIKKAIAGSSKCVSAGNQKFIYLNHMPDAVQKLLQDGSSSKPSGGKTQPVPFHKLSDNVQQMLSPAVEAAANSQLESASSQENETDGTLQDGNSITSSSVTADNTCSPTVPEVCNAKQINSSADSLKAGDVYSNNSLSGETLSEENGLGEAYFGSNSDNEIQGDVTGENNMEVTSSESVPPVDRSQVVLRDEPALELADFLKNQSCYIPNVRFGLFSYSGIPNTRRVLKVDRTNLQKKALDVSVFEKNLHSAPKRPKVQTVSRDQDNSLEKPVDETSIILKEEQDQDHFVDKDVHSASPLVNSQEIVNEIETLKLKNSIDVLEVMESNQLKVLVYNGTKCVICGDRYLKPEAFFSHIMYSHIKFKCQECFAVFTCKETLVQHLKTAHNMDWQPLQSQSLPKSLSQEVFKCGHCSKRFPNRRQLDVHQRKLHGALIRCGICDKTFADVYRLTSHISLQHLQQGGTVCDVCGKEFTVARYMQSHRRRHFKEKKHACSICGKKFLDTNTLKDHIQTHKPADERTYRYVCSYCGKRFNSKRCFMDHTNTHTGIRPYECKVCGKSFSYGTILKKHERSKHSDLRPFQCGLCSKAFKQNSTLRAHMVTHTGVSQHRCPYCQRSFGTASICKTHISKCKHVRNLQNDSSYGPVILDVIQASETVSSVAENLQGLSEDKGILQLKLNNQETVELQLITEETVQETYMYMCSACQATFEDMATAEVHINQCSGAISLETWDNQEGS